MRKRWAYERTSKARERTWNSEPPLVGPAMSPGKRSRKPRRRASLSFLRWWPVALAAVATPFAVRAASVLALSGPGALRLLYPSVALFGALTPHWLAPEQRNWFATGLLWLQFPVYGVLVVATLRWSLARGLLLVLLLHVALWLGALGVA